MTKFSVGDRVKIKGNIDEVLKTHVLYSRNDNVGIEEFVGESCEIVYLFWDEEERYTRYLIDIDRGDYWWVEECFY